MKQLIIFVGLELAVTLAFTPAPVRAETQDSSPLAVAVANQVMRALGGRTQWNALRGLRWSFGVEEHDSVRFIRRHAWDKHTGMHRVEGVNRNGQPFCVIHDIDDGTGKAWVAGTPLEGDSLIKLIDYAKAVWTNDTYWMLMPYKMRDPGVTLAYDGQVQEGDVNYDKVALSFHDVGMTPGDRYWVYVNRANHRVEKWEMVLQDKQPPPVAYVWTDWVERGGLWFATAHRTDDRNVFTRDVETVDAFDPKVFEAP